MHLFKGVVYISENKRIRLIIWMQWKWIWLFHGEKLLHFLFMYQIVSGMLHLKSSLITFVMITCTYYCINTFSTQPFFIYAQKIMVYNLTAHNYVSLKDNANKVCIKLKGIGCTIWKCKVKSFESRFMCFRKDRRKKKKRLEFFLKIFFHLTLA